MNIYQRKSRWKIYLAAVGITIIGLSMGYTQHIASKMAQRERDAMDIWVGAYEFLNNLPDNSDADVTFQSDIMQGNQHIPVIVTDGNGEIQLASNFGEKVSDEYIAKQLEKIKKSGHPPIKLDILGEVTFIYYKNSIILDRLRFFPIIQVCLIAAFIALGYLGFSNARRAEQNRVWVGMAKETAHQLGTPISAMIAWVEYLRTQEDMTPAHHEILGELEKDIVRLELIADRFSKIGSAPELKEANIYDELNKVKEYMEKRASRKVRFVFPDSHKEPVLIKVNAHLFEWVVENLIRNALDAMDGEGEIKAEIFQEANHVMIDISDTGKGISASMFRTVFQPGFTTKQRGWGLGLSLAKRIIENYHSGKIFVKRSEPGKGTTFTIKLPR
jgi:anti-sigma regulatory factor (Ser/Thr protein kinase)